ncbi:MAG TPA: hypothetical protein PKA00_05770 [Saprospiraceae bacterium]|nr:hypothetical protein [Saprospiraceae bacterium]HMQ82390.1 hypothetical protein [Saprospiraceae bacterium]
MKQTKLNPLQIRDLRIHYESELRKLEFQVVKFREIVAELEVREEAAIALALDEAEVKELPAASKSTEKEAQKEKGRPRKEKAASNKVVHEPEVPKKKGRPSKEEGEVIDFRPSPWDLLVIRALEEKDQVMIVPDFVEYAQSRPEPYYQLDEEQIKIMLNRAFVKMANRKDYLVKVAYEGRGHAYALKSWFTKQGELPKKYQR